MDESCTALGNSFGNYDGAFLILGNMGFALAANSDEQLVTPSGFRGFGFELKIPVFRFKVVGLSAI